MNKIKICHFADHLNGKVDGVFAYIKLIVENTDREKFKHYLCFQGNDFIEDEMRKINVETILLPEITTKFPLKALIKFYKICSEYDFDIIHAHFMKPYIVGGFANIFLKKKLIYNYHGHFIRNHFYNKTEQMILFLSHFSICFFSKVQIALVPSNTSRDKLLNETKLFPKIEVYYNGGKIENIPYVEDEVIKLIKADSSFKIVFAGRLVHQKRIDISLNIIKRLIEDEVDVKYYILGEGELKSNLETETGKLDIKNKVLFVGRVEKPQYYFKYCDLFLLTSDFEGLPNVFWEAMSVGLPILSSDVDGCKEIIELTGCGDTFNNRNIEQAVNKIKFLIKNPVVRKQMGNKGIKAVSEKYNVTSLGKKIESIYLGLYNTNGS